MADALTLLSSVTWDQAAYDRLAYFALRRKLFFDQVATVKPTRQAMPGSSVIFNQTSDMAVVSTGINESTDVDAVALADAQVTVTLVEYGNVAKSSAKLRGTSYLEVDPVILNVIGYNAGLSLDTIARDVLKGGSNVKYGSGGTTAPAGRTSIEPEDTITGNGIRRANAELRGASAMEWDGNNYIGYIHPDVSYDLRGGTGGANWRDVHTYTDLGAVNIMNGEVGVFENVRFVETPGAPVWADAGSSTTLTDVYGTIICGQESLAKAWSLTDGNAPMPRTFPTPPLDNLRRFLGHAWYWLGGYSIFRQASIRRIETSSSIGTNS